VRFNLIPREEGFFDLLEDASRNLDTGAKLLIETLRNPQDLKARASEMKAIEANGDRIVHDLMAKLHRTFITPLDREDIHDLISSIDDVLDYVEAAVDMFALYRVHTIRPQANELAEVIGRQTSEIQVIIPLLRKITQHSILPHCVEINRLENAADQHLRKALEELFVPAADPLEVIQWKDLYMLLEAATDSAEDVANVVEGIVLKNA
jgi:predicted phosphate transport protein (TIGR00153 family)